MRGWKLIVNAGSAGWVFDGDPTASWALVEVDGETVNAEIRRAEFDTMTPHCMSGFEGPAEIITILDHHGERSHLRPG